MFRVARPFSSRARRNPRGGEHRRQVSAAAARPWGAECRETMKGARIAVPAGIPADISKLRQKMVVITTTEKLLGLQPQFHDLSTVRS